MKRQHLKHFTSVTLEDFDEVASLAVEALDNWDDRERNGEESDYYTLKTLLALARESLFGAEIKRQERRALYETLKQEFEPSELKANHVNIRPRTRPL